MFDFSDLEVSVLIDFAELDGQGPVDRLSVHYLRLAEITSSPETLTRAIEKHLADYLETYYVVPDTSDPEALTFRVLGEDNTDLYRAGITLASRSLEPKVDCEQWGLSDISSHLGVAAVTVRAYLSRDQMPEPDGYIAGSPWWEADRIRAWERPRSRSRR